MLLSSLPLNGFAAASSPWFARVWQANNGLPGDNVTGLAQTKNGYLWIATQNGLARFDGVRFAEVPVSPGRARAIIWAMLLDRDERLWLAQQGGSVVRLTDGKATRFGSTNGLPAAFPIGVVQARDGAVWVSYEDGSACRILGNTVTRFTAAEGLTGTGACSLAAAPDGELWFAKAGRVGLFRDGQFVFVLRLTARSIRVLPATQGGIWICADDQLLQFKPGADPVPLGKITGDSAAVRPVALLEDRTGALWIGTASSGLFRYDGTAISKVETSHGRIRTLTEDREGNIWVGTDGGGLNRVRQRVVELQGKESGLPFETVRSVCEDASGALWLVTQDGGVVRSKGGPWESVSGAEDWPGGQANCVACDAAGVVWIGTFSRGLYRWQDGKFTTLQRRNGLAEADVRSLLADRATNLWIGSASGSVVQRLRDGQFQNFTQPEGDRAVRAMVEDTAGRIWLGTLGRRLLRVDGDKLVDETLRTELPARPIRCLTATSDGSLWIGYAGGGLGRLKAGRFARLSTKEGLYDPDICSLMPDDEGRIWFASDHGIFHATKSKLDNMAEGKAAVVKSVVYGQDDGLPSLQGYYGYAPGAARCRDGRILLPTHSGLAIVRPGLALANPILPRVIIESVAVDGGAARTGDGETALRLPPRHRKLEVTFTAPSFIAPEKVRYRHRLDGWDDDWVDAGDQHHVTYPRLPAGEYQFRVAACNSAGVWNESAATFGLVVLPFIWQTWWFRTVTTLLFTACVVAVVRYVSFRRLRTTLRRLEQETALQRERARIAEDIHDDLGAHMTQISLLGELTQRRPEQARELAGQMATMARKGINSLDEIVWAVNPQNDTLPHLLDYAGQYAVDFLKAAGVRCRLDFPADPPARALSAEARHGLLLVIKEALNNVVKHAQASEVSLRASVSDGELRWEIADNGRGFATSSDDAQANGLRNMRQRLAKLGGDCTIESQPGAGTKIRVQMPWKAS